MKHDDIVNRQAQEEADRHAAIDRAVEGWTPTLDHLVLATIKAVDKVTGSGLVIPGDTTLGTRSEKRGRLARIVAAGPEAVLAVGRRVYAPTYAGTVIDVDGQSLLVIKEGELLMVADEPQASVVEDPAA